MSGPSSRRAGDRFTFHWGSFERRIEMELNEGVVTYQLFLSGRCGPSGIVAASNAEKWLRLYTSRPEMAQPLENEPTPQSVETRLSTTVETSGFFAGLRRPPLVVTLRSPAPTAFV